MEFTQTLPLLKIHLTAIFTTLAVVVTADTLGLLWISGKKELLPHSLMRFLHAATWIGLATIMSAGFFMFISYSEYLLTLPQFWFKMVFVFALIVNAVFIGKHLSIATVHSFTSLSFKEKLPLFISGGVSTCSWIGAFICGKLL